MQPFEINELLALVFVLAAVIATLVARAHPSNTPRTRVWWSRFLLFLVFIAVAQLATNVEQIWPDGTIPRTVLNAVEHVMMAVAGIWVLTISARGLSETCERQIKGDA